MSRPAAWIAWSLWVLSVALATLIVLLGLISLYAPALIAVFFAVLILTYSTVGAFVASRRPGNPIGWIFCGAGLLIGSNLFFEAYDEYALYVGVSSGLAIEYSAWFLNQLSVPVLVLTLLLLLLLFPSGRLPSHLLLPEGRLPSRTWQAIVWMAVGGSTLVGLQFALTEDPSVNGYHIPSPLMVGSTASNVLVVGGGIGSFVLVVCFLFAGASLISRLVLASGQERQQLKWFAYAFALLIGGILGIVLLRVWTTGVLVSFLGFGIFPIVTGIAILKHRLYDIDVVINRTLIYGSLTVTLVAVYFGGVATTEAIFRALTGQEKQPQLVVVVSTLVIAALYTPLRRRIQSFIDRRFYRRKYDTRKTLRGFSKKLRNETDLDALHDDLTSVVRETMQPAHVSLWLRPETTRKSEESG